MATGNSTYVESILNEFGFEKVKRISGGFVACCKFHDDRNPSFSMRDNGFWRCFGCGEKGNIKALYERLGNGNLDWREACKMLGVQLRPKQDTVRRSRKRAKLPEDFSKYVFEQDVPPLISRRLEWPTIQRFGLGTAPGWEFRNRCIIPIYYKGTDIGYHGRDVTNTSKLKYLNPPNFDIKRYLFNYDGCEKGKRLFVVEGAFSCMSMVEKGFTNTVATFGTMFTPQQVGSIFDLDPSEVIVCFDRDPSKVVAGKERGCSGQRAAVKLAKTLHDNMIRSSIMPLPVGVDPNEASSEVLGRCFDGRVNYEDLMNRKAHNGSRRRMADTIKGG
jgi:DNA primase